MPNKNLIIYDDTVVKLSINQGTEDQRLATSLGAFTMGELIYVRDNARVFSGDCQNNMKEESDAETIGGVLVGNKYLGLVDSKPISYFDNNGKPLNYAEPQTYTLNDNPQDFSTWVEPSILGPDSKWKVQFPNETKDWVRTNSYNKKYGAYNGDYVYDVFSNAIILFDSRIQAGSEANRGVFVDDQGKQREYYTIDGKNYVCDAWYKTDADGNIVDCNIYRTGMAVDGNEIIDPLETLLTEEETPAEYYERRRLALLSLKEKSPTKDYTALTTHDVDTNQIYGDGFVVIRNVEPDNITTRFKPKGFRNVTGDSISKDDNFTHNILEVIDIPISALESKFNPTQFLLSGGTITLQKDLQGIDSISTSSANAPLGLPTSVMFGSTRYDFTSAVTGSLGDFQFVLVENPRGSASEPVSYSVQLRPSDEGSVVLGDGLITQSGKKTYKVGSADALTTDGIDGETTSDDPFYVGLKTKYAYSGSIGYNGGLATIVDTYEEDYLQEEEVFNSVNLFESQNKKYNYLKKPIPMCWVDESFDVYDGYYDGIVETTGEGSYTIYQDCMGVNAVTEFIFKPRMFCNRKKIDMGGSGVSFTNNRTPNNNKTKYLWDNYFRVLGNNSYLNWELADGASSVFFINDGSEKYADYSTSSKTMLMKEIPSLIEEKRSKKEDGEGTTISVEPKINVYTWESIDNTNPETGVGDSTTYVDTSTEILSLIIYKDGDDYKLGTRYSSLEKSELLTLNFVVPAKPDKNGKLVKTVKDIKADILRDFDKWVADKSGNYCADFSLISSPEDSATTTFGAILSTKSSLFSLPDAGPDIPIAIEYDDNISTIAYSIDETTNEEVQEVEEEVFHTYIDLTMKYITYNTLIGGYNLSEDFYYGTLYKVIPYTYEANADGSFKSLKPGGVISGDSLKNIVQISDGATVQDEGSDEVFIDVERLKAAIGTATHALIISHQDGKPEGDYSDGDLSYSYKLLQVTSNEASRVSLKDYHEPARLSGTVFTKGYTTPDVDYFNNAILDESVNANKTDTNNHNVTIPSHAHAALLEITHITECANVVGVYSSSDFGNLRFRKTSTANVSAEYDKDGLPRTNKMENSLYDGNTFLRLATPGVRYGETTEGSKKVFSPNIPNILSVDNSQSGAGDTSLFAPSPKEKCVMLSNTTETRIVSVPLIYDAVLKAPKCCLRFANVKGKQKISQSEYAKNAFHVRLVGYIS